METNHERLRHCVDLARDGILTPDNTDPYCLMTEADPVLKAEWIGSMSGFKRRKSYFRR